MKILVSKFMHIGDVLLITPLLENLKLHFPEAQIDVALNEGTEEMISNNPYVRHIHIYRRSTIKKLPLLRRLFAEWKFAQTLRQGHYDLLINLTSGDRGLLLAAYSGAKKILSHPSAKNPWLNRFIHQPLPTPRLKHWVDINLDALRIMGIEPLHKEVQIYWDPSIEERMNRLMKTYDLSSGYFIHFHPVSRWFFKCIDDALSARIIDYCQEVLKLPVVITAAPDDQEREKVKKILQYVKSEPINLSGQLTLKETAALNQHARAYIGVDTAIMHISAANNTPVLAFFGPSIPYAWGPWDNQEVHNRYTCYRGNQQMGRHRILQKAWACVPCDAKGCDNLGRSECLMDWDFDLIKHSIKELLQ